MGEVEKTIKTVMLDQADIRTYVWESKYDSWNRVREMIYPDGEKVTYIYNRGGDLQAMKGEKQGQEYALVDYMSYDKYGQLVYQKLGNGTQTRYSYDNTRNRLANMTLDNTTDRLMDNDYSYDAVSNILGIENKAHILTLTQGQQAPLGGGYKHSYGYDQLNRLITAVGSYQEHGKTNKTAYDLDMKYDLMSNILSKNQIATQIDSLKTDTLTSISYKMNYLYEGTKPNAPSMIGESRYTYDHNGNPILVEDTLKATFRQMLWDEENRLLMLSDNGYTSRYTYNHAGERVIKSHGGTHGVFVNGAPTGVVPHSKSEYTMYVSPFFVVTEGRFTKHYYAGTKRVSSRIGTGAFNNVFSATGTNITAGQKNYYQRSLEIEKSRLEQYKRLGIPPGPPTLKGVYGEPENAGSAFENLDLGNYDVPASWPRNPILAEPNNPPGPPIQWEPEKDTQDVGAGYGYVNEQAAPELYQYFYHSDHLGSTSYVTDRLGVPTQFVVYMPWGETLAESHNTSYESPYLFNGKELDSETGLYYYGARYYDPRISVFYGVDPLTEKYPNIGGYLYCYQNPVKFIDPTGMETWEPYGNSQLRAQEGDNMGTLRTYLTEIYGEYGILDNEWDELENQVRGLEESSVGGDISGNTISSSTGLFENLVGTLLMTKANLDPSWGYPEYLRGKGDLCSPTTFNRVSLAMKFVYGKEILGKLSGSNPLYARWNAFDNVKGTKYGEVMIPEMGYGTSINEKGILNGELKPGAVLRMTQSPGPQNTSISWHAVIFLNYTYDSKGEKDGIRYWQQRVGGKYIGESRFNFNNNGRYIHWGGYKPKLGANFK